jgi:hypothetical protein
MRRGLWSAIAFALTVGLVHGEVVEKRRVVLKSDEGNVFEANLDDLGDGETRTFQDHGKTIEVTRHGDELQVKVDGESMDGKGEKKIFVHSSSNTDGSKSSEKKIIVWNGEGEAPEGLADIPAIPFRPGRVTYRCAENGVEISLKKEDAVDEKLDNALCPSLMDKVEAPKDMFFYHVSDGEKPSSTEAPK